MPEQEEVSATQDHNVQPTSQRQETERDEPGTGVLGERSDVLLDQHERTDVYAERDDELWRERESRNQLKHVTGLGELHDVTEVEYRKIRLERVVLVGVWSSRDTTLTQAEESLRELAALAETAGAQVVDGVLQHRSRPDSATYVGSGKAKEIADIVAVNEADTIIVDADLPPSQRRALEDVTRVKVVDRTAVILDIFAQHAQSREGKAQVELAQLQYMLPRLRGWGAALSRQAGGRAAGADAGIGSRGPGETKIEMDRRVIRTRIARLRKQIAQMAPSRQVKRGSRRRTGLPTVAVVGYTNAGKSSLTNRLTGSSELVENALFATLDTAVRRAQSADGRRYAYVDTVGFVRRLPTQLVEAFKSTLEEVGEADLIVHVVDSSHPDPFSQIDAVNDVLKDIDGVGEIPTLTVFNKADLIDNAKRERIASLMPDAFIVSSASGEGIDTLRESVEGLLPRPDVQVEALLPYTAGSLINRIREFGELTALDYRDTGIAVIARVDDRLAARIMDEALPDEPDNRALEGE
ncbi:GTPase HflX [Bifidobacterium gallicum]|uniref:GTPase HflX n=1 Tax=Bifidobacterium gallicum DSM 20093 = LMG 11596 TaxID=561180 RepID=D1NSV0_9BIFI|nr:GTPase HflX [Bifidobacterium gallicum]EFA23752.1 GTP-binding protein HflX [Bifidobacterium gallicum DSM 20093 = LMG 11596]KFI59231.1 GTP-binding protein [Bifidobacterium gallicum DSM 20093 = LMG 11596]